MKRIILAACSLLLGNFVFSQFDNQFYFPSKTLVPVDDSLYPKPTRITYKIDKDTLSILVLNPAQKAVCNVLYFHGTGGNATNYVEFVKPMLEKNYRIYMIDSRGYGLSSGTPTHVNISSDAQITFDKFKRKLTSLPLIVYGSSMGGQVAAKIAADNQQYMTALVLDGTFTSFTNIAMENAPADMKETIRMYVTSPYSAIDCLKQLHNIPVLIIHSEEDTKIGFAHAQQLFDVANEPKSLWKYNGEHLEAPVLYKEEFLNQIAKLLPVEQSKTTKGKKKPKYE